VSKVFSEEVSLYEALRVSALRQRAILCELAGIREVLDLMGRDPRDGRPCRRNEKETTEPTDDEEKEKIRNMATEIRRVCDEVHTLDRWATRHMSFHENLTTSNAEREKAVEKDQKTLRGLFTEVGLLDKAVVALEEQWKKHAQEHDERIADEKLAAWFAKNVNNPSDMFEELKQRVDRLEKRSEAHMSIHRDIDLQLQSLRNRVLDLETWSKNVQGVIVASKARTE
jgi:small-conductance mechanosensitive channel